MTEPASVGTSEPLLSKRRLAWAGAAAVGGCAALCSLPLLAAAVLGGGGAATAIASFARPGTELVLGGIAFAAALFVMAVRATSKRATKPAGASTRQGDVPIACDPLVFTKGQRTEHHELSRNVIVRWPAKREELVDGYLFHYEGNEERFLAIARWASSEHRCCAWASFSVEMDPFTSEKLGAVRLRMRGGAEGKALLTDGCGLLAGDQRAEMFLNPTAKITPEAFAAARAARGCGC